MVYSIEAGKDIGDAIYDALMLAAEANSYDRIDEIHEGLLAYVEQYEF